MAKKSMIEREKKRQRLVAKYAAKRAELKEQKPEIGASLGRRAGGMVQQLRRACSSYRQ